MAKVELEIGTTREAVGTGVRASFGHNGFGIPAAKHGKEIGRCMKRSDELLEQPWQMPEWPAHVDATWDG